MSKSWNRWTDAELATLERCAADPAVSYAATAAQLGRPVDAIKRRAARAPFRWAWAGQRKEAAESSSPGRGELRDDEQVLTCRKCKVRYVESFPASGEALCADCWVIVM